MISEKDITALRVQLNTNEQLLQELVNRRASFPNISDLTPCYSCRNAQKSLEDGAIAEGCKKCYPALNRLSEQDEEAQLELENLLFRVLAMSRANGKILRCSPSVRGYYINKDAKIKPVNRRFDGYSEIAGC